MLKFVQVALHRQGAVYLEGIIKDSAIRTEPKTHNQNTNCAGGSPLHKVPTSTSTELTASSGSDAEKATASALGRLQAARQGGGGRMNAHQEPRFV